MQEKGLTLPKIEEKAEKVDFRERVNVLEIIEQANRLKHRAEEEKAANQARKDAERQRLEELSKLCTANYFYKQIRQFFFQNYGRFDFDESNKQYIKTICYFMSSDPRFETELGYSFSKGLWVQGTAGLGKTKVLEAVADNPLFKIRIASMIEIADAVREYGEVRFDPTQMLLIDDAGSEQPEVMHYGTRINWFKDFIEGYYLQNKIFTRLIVTTNCSGEDIQQRYGYRVRSRVREMFNQVTLTGTDRRK